MVSKVFIIYFSLFIGFSLSNDSIQISEVEYDVDGLPQTISLEIPGKWENHKAVMDRVSKSQNVTYANYTNVLTYDTFQIRKKENGELEFYGTFISRQHLYYLHPSNASVQLEGIKQMFNTKALDFNGTAYTLTYLSIKHYAGDSYPILNVQPGPNFQELVVETMLYIDYTVLAKWTDLHNGDEKKAKKALKDYYIKIMNEVNEIYKKMERRDFSISIQLSHIHISEESLFVNKSDINGKKIRVGVAKAIEDADLWLQNSDYFLKYDLVLYVAHLDLSMVKGVANYNQICSATSTALVLGTNHLEIVHSIAHEIGHVLGAPHDGESNDCKPELKNLMSPSITHTQDFNATHLLSPCSVGYIKLKVKQLDSDRNCLLETTHHPINKTEDGRLIGQLLSLDDQCRLIYGQDSYFCGGSNICEMLRCFRPSKNDCDWIGRQMAADGSHCGNKKWCYKGSCVENDNAPITEDKCFLGDDLGLIDGFYGPITCDMVKILVNSQCYYPQYQEACCETCAKLHTPEFKDCEYGDKEDLCEESVSSNPLICRLSELNHSCCKSCPKYYKENDIGTIDPSQATGDCDDGEYCFSSDINRCYDKEFGENCCATCNAVINPKREGCEFGNRKNTCKEKECSKDCCSKCSDDELKALKIEKFEF